MKQYLRRILPAVLLVTLSVPAFSQAQQTPISRPGASLKVQVVITRFDGDKRISSLPYSLSVTANERPGVTLRMGSQVPVPATSGYQYMNVGTNIDCVATSTDDGRFKVEVRIEDSSVVERRSEPRREVQQDFAPTLRSFTSSNSVILRDGQSTQFTAATDKTTGELVRVDVTLTVEK